MLKLLPGQCLSEDKTKINFIFKKIIINFLTKMYSFCPLCGVLSCPQSESHNAVLVRRIAKKCYCANNLITKKESRLYIIFSGFLKLFSLRRIKIMFLDHPSVLLNLVLFVPSTRCFAVAELRATRRKKNSTPLFHWKGFSIHTAGLHLQVFANKVNAKSK